MAESIAFVNHTTQLITSAVNLLWIYGCIISTGSAFVQCSRWAFRWCWWQRLSVFFFGGGGLEGGWVGGGSWRLRGPPPNPQCVWCGGRHSSLQEGIGKHLPITCQYRMTRSPGCTFRTRKVFGTDATLGNIGMPFLGNILTMDIGRVVSNGTIQQQKPHFIWPPVCFLFLKGIWIFWVQGPWNDGW